MKYMRKIFVIFASMSMILCNSFISESQELTEEQINNYIAIGMNRDDLAKIQLELEDVDDPNYVTKTEQEFYINKMGITKEDINHMLEEQNAKEESEISNRGIALRTHGPYPTQKGIVLVTKDKVVGVVPLGHAAIVYNTNEVIEAHPIRGVHSGPNDWDTTRKIVYGLKVHRLSTDEREEVANWCGRKRSFPYNPNFYNVNTRSKFYCSQLVWAGFKDVYNIDLNGDQYGQAIYPPEMIDSGYVYRIYIQGDGY